MLKSYQSSPVPDKSGKANVALALILLLVQMCLCLYLVFYLEPPFFSLISFLLLLWGTLSAAACLWLARHLVAENMPDDADDFNDLEGATEPNQALRIATNFTVVDLVEQMSEGLVMVRDGVILFGNQPFAYFVGMRADELAGERLTSLLHHDDVNVHDLAVKQELRADTPVRRTFRLVTSMGDITWVTCSIRLVMWEGAPCSLYFFENIGPFKEAMRNIEEKDLQQTVFIEKSPFGAAVFDTAGQLSTANSLWHTMWSNVVGLNSRMFNILQDNLLSREDFVQAVHKAFQKEESSVSALEHSAPWGETRWMNIYFYPVVNAANVQTSVIMIQQDITDEVRYRRRETEIATQLNALRKDLAGSYDSLARFLDIMPYAIVVFDKNKNIQFWNTVAEQRFSTPRRKALGLSLDAMGEVLVPYNDIVQRAILAGADVQDKHFSRYYDTKVRQESLSVSITGGAGGNLYILQVRDLSESLVRESNQALADQFAASARLASSILNRLDVENPKKTFLQKLQAELTAIASLEVERHTTAAERGDLLAALDNLATSMLSANLIRPVVSKEYPPEPVFVAVGGRALEHAFDVMLNVLNVLSGSTKPELTLRVSLHAEFAVVELCSASTIITEQPGVNIFNPFAHSPALAAIEDVRFDLAKIFAEINSYAGMAEFVVEPQMNMAFICRFPVAP